MRTSDEWIAYFGVILAFGAVVAWASGASAPVVAAFGAGAATLVLLGAWSARRAPRVLVVGPRRTEAVDLMDEALDEAGFVVCSCDGPEARLCPFDYGRPCPIKQTLSGAVIVRTPDDVSPVPRCGEALNVPATTVEGTPEAISSFRSSLSR